jgi:CrcB protein
LFLAVGVLGGFTTFSAFSVETLAMLQRGAGATALAYVGASVAGSLAFAALGWTLVRTGAQA